MTENRWITPDDLDLERRHVFRSRVMDLNEARMAAEKNAIQTALRLAGNNLSLAAKSLNISRMTLYRLMEKVGLHGEKPDDGGEDGSDTPPLPSPVISLARRRDKAIDKPRRFPGA